MLEFDWSVAIGLLGVAGWFVVLTVAGPPVLPVVSGAVFRAGWSQG